MSPWRQGRHVDPSDGSVLAAQRWNELDPGTRINSFLYPLHTGELGGAAGQAIVALLGLGLGALGISGIWLWWRRQSLRRKPARSGESCASAGQEAAP